MSNSRLRRRLTLRRLAREDAGLGMTEVIVALLVFAIMGTTSAYGILNALALTQQSRSSETASSIASSDLDQMRLLASVDANSIFSVLTTSTPTTSTVGGTVYSLTRQASWQSTDGSTGSCGTGTGTLQYKNVTDTVSWKATNNVNRSITMSSAIAPLSNINSDTTGTIIVTVTGAAGQPVPGLTVSITPVSGGGGSTLDDAPQNTDNAGCSFGLLVDPGTYKVTASLAGDIDFNQNAIATTPGAAPVSVVAGQNTILNFTYDQSANFPLTYPAGAALPTNLPITFWHATPVPPPAPFAAAASVTAFPWGDGYTIVAGAYVYTAATSPASCLDPNPASWTTTRADGAVAVPPTPVAAGPGTTAAITPVPMGTFTMSGISNKYVTAITTTPGTGDPGCNASQTLTFPKTTSGSGTFALPFGTWKLYCGTTAGSTATACSTTNLNSITGGTLNLVGAVPTSLTLDPRVGP